MNQIGEFNLIQKYFENRSQPDSPNLVLGIGDDAAVTSVPSGKQLVSTMDTLIAGRHFPVQTHPADIAFKSLAVNVSDLCAMGADPAWFLLSLSLPEADEGFLGAFADGLFEAANQFGITLIGGDTCKGPTSVSIQASGLINEGCFITRQKAQVGDAIFVSGQIGAAALGLELINKGIEDEESHPFRQALNRPQPRTDLISLIRDYATAAIDVSD
jgi:thiamine-monophosphate kinase